MYAIKLELKLNNKQRSLMAQHAGFTNDRDVAKVPLYSD
jgi:hypothetical protein